MYAFIVVPLIYVKLISKLAKSTSKKIIRKINLRFQI
jgi:hypothetical protein